MVRRSIRIGEPLRENLPELVGTPSFERLERVFRDGVALDSKENKVLLVGADGEARVQYFNTSYRPLLDARGSTIGVISVSSDVTDQVQTRLTIDEARGQAVAANRAKDEFLAMLGHELRNPLAPILTALELMRLRGDNSLLREREIIERQTRHLSSLVEDLLDVSRIVRGMVQLKKQPVALAEIVARAIETSAPLFEQRRHELVTDVPRGVVLDADPDRLTQVFANLLTNAAKYTDPGGRVSISAVLRGGAVVVTVSDTGRGISADILPRVFDLFVQDQQHIDRSRGGLGLGLAIVKNLVGLHGGEVSVTSSGLGKGTAFAVSLPAANPHPVGARDASGGDALTNAAKSPEESRVAILIVDDNVDAASILGELLQLRGYVTRTAHDGMEALRLAEEFVPDVAILDIGLPLMDGFELARRVRALPGWRAVKLCALTGYGQSEDRARSKAAGFDEHFVKPIDLAQLEAMFPPSRSAGSSSG
jgi:signal transduction histidine kinase/CheY-like chemotaxis protein